MRWTLKGSVATARGALERGVGSGLRERHVLELSLVLAAYLLCGRIGLAVPFTSDNVSLVWPAAGIALAALLLVGYRVWPAIATAAFLVNFFTAVPVMAAVGIAAGNTAGPLVGAWLTRRISGFHPSLNRLTDVLAIILIAAPIGAAISAAVGTAVLFTAGLHPWGTFSSTWRIWWLGDSMGVLIVSPLLLTLSTRKLVSTREAAELGTLVAAVTVTCLLMFHLRFGVENGIVLAAALTPFVLWGAIRFETLGAATVVFLVSGLVLWETFRGVGPFAQGLAANDAILLQAFVAIIAVSGLTLAAVMGEKAHLIREQARREGAAENERKYRHIVETANEGIWMLDDRLVTIFANPRLADLLGYTVPELTGKPLSDFMFEEDSPRNVADLQPGHHVFTEQLPRRYRKKDGSELCAAVSRTTLFNEYGTFTGVLKMVSDVTDQKRAEEETLRTRRTVLLLSQAVEQTADSVILTDSGGRIEYVNPAFEATTGYTREEAVGSTPRLLKSGQHDEEFYTGMWKVLLRGEPYRGTLINSRKNGERYWAEQTITPMKDPHGHITHFVSVLKDVTEARTNQEQQVRLRLARQVQQRFYRSAVIVPGFDIGASAYPAEQTGGDYFDMIETPDGRCYIAIGDVSGHGLDAALVMAMTRAYVRSFAALGLDVAEILTRTNKVLVGDLQENRFVTLLLGLLDPQSRTFRWASAGHLPGYLLNRAGKTEAAIESTGVPLGLFLESAFAARSCRLEPGHLLVLSTDGASETSTDTDEEFGCDGVLQHVRGHLTEDSRDIAEGIYRAARSFAAGKAQTDDITSVIIKVDCRDGRSMNA
jgi:PAS domain S-box-containing protein